MVSKQEILDHSEAICHAYRHGKSIWSIGNDLGIGYGQVKDVISENEAVLNPDLMRPLSDRETAIANAYRDNMDLNRMKMTFGIGMLHLDKIIQSAGIRLRKRVLKQSNLDHLMLPLPNPLVESIPTIRWLPRIYQKLIASRFCAGATIDELTALYHQYIKFPQ